MGGGGGRVGVGGGLREGEVGLGDQNHRNTNTQVGHFSEGK